MIAKRLLHQLLLQIRQGALQVHYWDGSQVTYGQGDPYFSLHIKSPAAIRAIFKNMTLGFGESYMDGLIDIDGDLRNVGRLVSDNQATFGRLALTRHTHLPDFNRQSRQARQVQHHYDVGNDFYKLWLDESMTYSCAYFRSPKDSLETAQRQKVDHLLRKLQLTKGQRLLEIGSGWGTLLITAARDYGITGLGVTLSRQQYEHSIQAAKEAGVDKQIRFELIGYQDLIGREQPFDRIISVGMYEHVGRHNQADYFRVVDQLLADGGISVLHTISTAHTGPSDPWIDKYIFPGGYLPTASQITGLLERHQLQLQDYENLRLHYAMTLDEWLRRFERHQAKVIKLYDERFYRMWKLYLASSSAGFRYGDLSLSQFVFTKGLNNQLPLTREHLYASVAPNKKSAS